MSVHQKKSGGVGTTKRREKEGNIMKIYTEISLEDFEAWSGAVSTLDRIKSEGKCDELEATLEELYPDGMDETQLNDLLWFEEDWIFETLGIRTESEIREELEEAREELAELMERFSDEIEEREDFSEEKLSDDAKDEIWSIDYKDDADELKEKIKELEEELENI